MARGRKKGSKNLSKKGDKLINQYGVQFTEAEKRRLESLVNSANRKRRRMLENEAQMKYFVGGQDTGVTRGDLVKSKLGKESDFILAPKSKSLNRFRNKTEYNKYIKNLERVVDRDYINKRVDLYRDNFYKAVRSPNAGFTKEQQDFIINTVKKLSRQEYMEIVQGDDAFRISYQYLPSNVDKKFNSVKNALSRKMGDNETVNGGLRNNNRQKRR